MLKNRQDLIALREGCMAAAQLQKRRILVCAGTGCVSSGSLKIFDRTHRSKRHQLPRRTQG